MWSRDKSDKADKNLFDKPVDKVVEKPARVEPVVASPPSAIAPVANDAKGDAARKPATAAAPPAPAAARGSVLGATLRFKGDLAADEDLIVQGQVEGSILHSRSLTIGPDGSMTGDIRARRIVIEGRVTGDLYALESVTVRSTGQVRGNLYAPRVAVADGAQFNGRIDMEKAPSVPHAVGGQEPELSTSDVESLLRSAR